jgi:transcriptional regulator with GAF, ATPase, and Fis domain
MEIPDNIALYPEGPDMQAEPIITLGNHDTRAQLLNKIHTAMHNTKWDTQLASELLGITEHRLLKLISKYQLDFPTIPPLESLITDDDDDGNIPEDLL